MFYPDKALDWFLVCKANKIYYSWDNPRTGVNGHGDCSGVLYESLIRAGLNKMSWVPNTDSLHNYLTSNGFELVAHNKEYTPKKGTIFILGKKDFSGGEYGHTGIFTGERENILHCNYKANGVSIDDFNTMYNNSVKVTPQLKDWYFYEYKKTPNKDYNNFKIGDYVTVQSFATHYETGEKIAKWVLGTSFYIRQIKEPKNPNTNSKKAYLLSKTKTGAVLGWVLAQDVR